jgi:hypothetical protein
MQISLGLAIIVLLTAVTAYCLKGITGFGLSLIMVPVLSLFLDFRVVIVIVTLADLVSSLIIFFKNRTKVDLKMVSVILIGLFIGTFIGVNFFNNFPTDLLKKIFGVFLIAITLKNIIKVKSSEKWAFKKSLGFLAGLIGGIFGGMFNVNGPPIVMFVKNSIKDKLKIRSNLSLIFAVDAGWRAFLFAQTGALSFSNVSIFASLVLPGILVGYLLVEVVFKKVSSRTVSKVIEIVLLVLGSGLVFN